MAIRTVDLGGTNVADGDIFFAADFNDTFGAVTLHRKQFSDTTIRTSTSTSFENSGTAFTLSIPVNSMIIGFYVLLRLRVQSQTGSDNASSCLEINGTNLGSLFLTAQRLESDQIVTVPSLETTETDLFNSLATSLTSLTASGFTPLKILDASTTFTIRIKTNDASRVAELDNVTIDVLYTEVFSED